jgi:hypothetical protein
MDTYWAVKQTLKDFRRSLLRANGLDLNQTYTTVTRKPMRSSSIYKKNHLPKNKLILSIVSLIRNQQIYLLKVLQLKTKGQ